MNTNGGNYTIGEKIAKGNLYSIGYKYLCDNFHKFKEHNKIKVSLAILSIFNKDGEKTEGKTLIYIVNGREYENGAKLPSDLLQISSAQSAENNPGLEKEI